MAKSTKPMIRIHNLETNEIIDREMNDDEYAVWLADKEFAEQIIAEDKALDAQKQALLERLGITADEAKLLLG
jgi:hypothetical protein